MRYGNSEKLPFDVEAPKYSSPPQVAPPTKALYIFLYLNFSMEHEEKQEVSDQEFIQSKDKAGETEEQREDDIEQGKAEEDVYTEAGRENLLDEDAIDPWEEAFMEGAEGRGQMTSCRYCGKSLSDEPSQVVERKIEEHDLRFCSDECAEKYMKKRGKKLI